MAANYANLSSSSSSSSKILDDSNVFSPRNTTTGVKRENPYYEDFDSNTDFVPPTKRLKNEPDVGRPASTLAPSRPAPSTKVSQKPPAQVARRNQRERNRVQQVNMGFVKLRNHIPLAATPSVLTPKTPTSAATAAAASKKLSKVETLRAAAEYIKYLHKILNIENPSKDTSGQGASNCNNSNFPAYQPANHFSCCNNENLRYNNAECDHQASLYSSPCSSTGGGATSSTDTSPQIIMNNFYANEAYHQQTWYY